MALQLNRIAKKTALYRQKLAKASVGVGTPPLITKFACFTGGTDAQGNVTTPTTSQSVSGTKIYEKNFKNSGGTILSTRNGNKVLRYDSTHWAVVACELLKNEGTGVISQVILYDQNGDVAIKHHLPNTTKTNQSFFLEEIYIGS